MQTIVSKRIIVRTKNQHIELLYVQKIVKTNYCTYKKSEVVNADHCVETNYCTYKKSAY